MSTDAPDFAQVALEYFKARDAQRPVALDTTRDRLVVGAPPGPVGFVHLGHARREYEAAAVGEHQRVLARRFWSQIHTAPPDGPRRLLDAMLPKLRDRAWFSAVRRQAELELGADEAAIDEVMLPHLNVNDELAVHLAWELPTSVMEVTADRLTTWALPFDDALKAAKANLAARSTEAFVSPADGVWVSPWHDGLDASRMLLVELFESLEVKGRPVAIAPTHDLLFVTGDGDDEGLAQVASWAEDALLEPRAHSAIAFRLEDGQWRPWLPARAHPAWSALKLLSLQTLASAYARQKEVLEALLEANGHELVVAGLRAFRAPSGDIFTACAWTDGIDALLPRTDRIDFIRPGPDGAIASGRVWSTRFDLALQTVPELMETSGDEPERFRVHGFPSDAQLTAMAEAGKLP